MFQEAYDIIIVGAGAAGCVVASYLAEHTDASIALIEAGDMDRDPFIHIPAGFAKMLAHDRHVWTYETIPQHGTKRAYRSGKVLGGGSSINAMCYVRGQIRDYAAWQDAVGDTGKWSYEDLLPVFMAQEHNDTFHDEYHGIDGGLSVQLPKGINKLNQYCLKAFQEYGLPYNPDYNGESQIGVSPVQSTVGNQRRCSAVDAYLRPHLASGRVTLLTGKTVVRILVENKRAVGVELTDNGLERIMADEVVLSAGTVHSPKILMHSGIGPAEQLRQHGIAVIVNSPEVGENLHDHSIVPVRAYVKGDLGYQAAAQGLGTVKAGLRYFVTKDGPASGNGIETVSHWNPSDFAAEPTIQCYHVPIIAADGISPTGDRSGITFELVVLQSQEPWLGAAGRQRPDVDAAHQPELHGRGRRPEGSGGIGARGPQGHGAGVAGAGDRGRDRARPAPPVGRRDRRMGEACRDDDVSPGRDVPDGPGCASGGRCKAQGPRGRRSAGNRRLDHAEHHQWQYQRPDPGARAPRHGDVGRRSEADLGSSGASRRVPR